MVGCPLYLVGRLEQHRPGACGADSAVSLSPQSPQHGGLGRGRLSQRRSDLMLPRQVVRPKQRVLAPHPLSVGDADDSHMH